LNKLLGEEPFEDAARDALVAMGPAGIHALLENLRDPATDLSSPVSITLKRMVAAAPLVRPLLKDENPEIRRRAAYVLGGIRDPSTLEDLIYRLSTELFPPFYLGPDVEDREELVEPVDWVRVAVANALGEFGDPRGLEMLKRSLEDESSEVRDAAVRALGTLRDVRATPWLIEFRREEKDKKIRRHVLEALGNIADPKAIEALLAELASTGDLVGAWTALESVGKRGVEHLGSLL
jgi:HEAT repeat protein